MEAEKTEKDEEVEVTENNCFLEYLRLLILHLFGPYSVD